MGERFKKDWPSYVVNLLISLIVIFVGFKLTIRDTDARELNKKIDSKAAIEDVKLWDQVLQDQITKSFFEQKQLKDELNTRLQRIEEKQDATNDKILDIWKSIKTNGK